jgi:NitT/TauT family transport system permease protein
MTEETKTQQPASVAPAPVVAPAEARAALGPIVPGKSAGWTPGRWLVIREELGFAVRVALGAIPILVLLGAWWRLTYGAPEERVISPLTLPSPVEVVKAIHGLWFEAELSRSLVASAMRVVGGFVAALAIAFPLGVLMGSFSKVRALFEPLMVFGTYLPIPTLVPLTMSLFGIDELQKIMFLAIAFLVFLLPMFVGAISAVDDTYLQTAQTLGASKWQTVRHVLLGVALPRLYDAMRMGFGIGWTYIILAEMVAADRGLGQIIIVAQRRGPRENIYLVLVVIVLVAFVADKIWAYVGKQLFPYREAE